MKKIIYSLIVGVLAFTATAVYGANDLTLESGFEFTVNGMTFAATGNIDELIVNDSTFVVDISSGSTMVINSADGYTFGFTPHGTVNFDCLNGASKLTIYGGADVVHTFTPSTTICARGTTGGGSSGGSSSYVGSQNPTPAPTPKPAPTNIPVTPIPISSNLNQNATSSTPGVPAKGADGKVTLGQMTADASSVFNFHAADVAKEMGLDRDVVLETKYKAEVVNKVINKLANVSSEIQNALTNFVTYGTKSTKTLGAGERAGVVDSYLSAFGKLPTSAEDWNDVVKIANGRWPSVKSATKEATAKISFKTIYLREADMNNPNDNAAVTVMAYGLRPADRNLDSEKAAINTFRYVFGYSTDSASNWDAVRAIAYSGATR